MSPPSISVPKGLSANDVELALVLAVTYRAPPPTLSPGQQITDNVLGAVLGPDYESVGSPKRPWYFEGRDIREVFVGYQNRAYYMRVRADYDDEFVTLSIEDSRHLSQTETHIHKRAFAFLQQLESAIRRTMGSLACRGLYEPDESADESRATQ